MFENLIFKHLPQNVFIHKRNYVFEHFSHNVLIDNDVYTVPRQFLEQTRWAFRCHIYFLMTEE